MFQQDWILRQIEMIGVILARLLFGKDKPDYEIVEKEKLSDSDQLYIELIRMLDEGKINDAQGRTVDFSNTVICMTSNAGSSDQSAGSLGFNKSDAQRSEEKTRKALAQFLRPEFLGRVDEVIAFKPLTEETLQGIAALMLDEYKPGMEAKGIAYSYTPAALKALVQKSQGGRFGARDLRRTIRKAVEDPAAERLIDGTLASGGTLVVDADENGEVVLK